MRFEQLSLSLCLVALAATPAAAQRHQAGPPTRDDHRSGDVQIDIATQDTLGIRYESVLGSRGAGGWLTTQSPTFVNIPQAAASFVAQEDDTTVAITFSAEAYTSSSARRLFVRALVDGKRAEPSDIVFTEGGFKGARAFTFTQVVDQGIHSVEMQWLVDPDEQYQLSTAYMRGASVQIRTGQPLGEGGSIWHETPPSGPEDNTQTPSWSDIPDGGGWFWVPEDSTSMLVFSAEAFVNGGNDKRMFIRPLIDGAAVASPSDVVFARSNARGVRQFVFKLPKLTPGNHSVQMQWQVDGGGVGTMGDRTLMISSYPSGIDGLTHRVVAAPSGPSKTTNSTKYETVPDLSTLAFIPENGEISVTVSAEVHAPIGNELWVRINVGGETIAEEEVVLGHNDEPFSSQTFTFDRKHVFGKGITGISAEWKVIGGGVASIGDRTLAILIEPGTIPDVAEAPAFGGGNVKIEPAIGKRKLLTILWDAHRPAPHDQTPAKADVVDALFGSHSVRDYFERNSGGRLTLQNEGVIGWFDAANGWDYYWNSHPGCGGGSQYKSGHQEKWAEAIDMADMWGYDFASYDTNRDGILQTSELGILIVIVQDTDFGTAQPSFKPYCNGDDFVVDGVIIPELFEWYTSEPQRFFSTAAHELSHLYFDMGDLYIDGYSGNTEPGNMSLMGGNYDTSAHFDGANKLAMGWVTPVIIEESGQYEIPDVKVSERVFILPRRNGGDGREYFLLENRQSSVSDPLYDENIAASGIVLWHIIEDPAQSAFAPNCVDQTEWDAFVSGNARRGIRLMRAGIKWGSLKAAWKSPYYDLLDNGLVCPFDGDDANNRRNTLTWADGTPSGYSILNWPANSAAMTVDIVVN